ncbi:MAG: hypothetical protein HY754_10085 [Nitrospirae bacterium]|nr:hypothetical protein [Nitrospirota bacterium]
MEVMPLKEDITHMFDAVIFSCEARLQSLGAISETTRQILQGVNDSLNDAKRYPFPDIKQERERIKAELRESLARNKSLRKKDFDNMMRGILSVQDEKEKEVRNLLNDYFIEQKSVTEALRENLAKLRESFHKGEVQRVKELQEQIKDILTGQEEGKKKVIARLKDFQREQQELIKNLRELLSRGKDLGINDLKLLRKKFNNFHREKTAGQTPCKI